MISRETLEAARVAALSKLGRTGETTLAKLEAAGLVVVRRADLPPVTGQGVKVLEGVTVQTPANWREPWPVTVYAPDGQVLHLVALRAAAAAIGEAVQLQAVMGHQLNVAVARDEGLLLSATAVSG
ncbi:hypothetical protein [Deinococcus hohokamensis]|uniref:Uncharacterized protein n=1 Tax=Deinococcus hohokamensis TaxID=309883 RepID=A0ABV9I4D7_9DEIO